MSNPLFNALGGGMPQGNGLMQMIQQFMQFKQNFKGDPKEEVQKMLQSGQIDVNTQKGDYNYGWKFNSIRRCPFNWEQQK